MFPSRTNGKCHPFFFRQSSEGPPPNTFRLCRTAIHPLPTRWAVPFTLLEEEGFSRIMLKIGKNHVNNDEINHFPRKFE